MIKADRYNAGLFVAHLIKPRTRPVSKEGKIQYSKDIVEHMHQCSTSE